MRETSKNVEFEIDGEMRHFYITKMNAFDGAYLMKIVTEKAMPLIQEAIMGMGKNSDAEDSESLDLKLIADMLPRALSSLSHEEMKKLMILCLSTVQLSLPAGYQYVVDGRGNFGVEELQYNTAACLRLVYEVIVLNCSDFFAESGLSSLLAQVSGSRQGR